MSGNPLMTADKRKYFQKVKHASLRFSQIHEQNMFYYYNYINYMYIVLCFFKIYTMYYYVSINLFLQYTVLRRKIS